MGCIRRMTARIESLACKNRKTNEIWLLGEVSESGTLSRSTGGGREALARQHRLGRYLNWGWFSHDSFALQNFYLRVCKQILRP
jgi:hypothetical protein